MGLIQKLLWVLKFKKKMFDLRGVGTQKKVMPLLQVLVIMLSCLFVGFSEATDTISIGQPIRDSAALVSRGKRFKLSFFSPENSSFRYAGIMFDNIPKMTVVWVANRDKPLKDLNGTIRISEDGNLVVLDGRNGLVWSSNLTSSLANSSAQLLDSGNLVLRDNLNDQIMWESFKNPSDSILPKMKFFTDLSANQSNTLTSWRSSADPALGRFTSTIEPLEIPQIFVWNGTYPYWRSGPWNGQVFNGLNVGTYYQNGFEVTNNEPGYASVTFSYSNTSVLSYFSLSSSGILSLQFWDHGIGNWVVLWTSKENECEVYGKCGPFGTCDAKKKQICACLQGYVPKNSEEWRSGNWSGGCTRKTPFQCQTSASLSDSTGKEDGFLKLSNIKLPDNSKFGNSAGDECKIMCFSDCSCIAYAFNAGIGCLLWNESLLDVQKFEDGGSDLHIRLAHSELGSKKDMKAIIASVASLGFITISICTYCLWKRIRGSTELSSRRSDTAILSIYSKESMLKGDLNGVTLEELTLFTLDTLSNATNQFDLSNKLGQGGFGSVYKGKLPNGEDIAVKRLVGSSNQGLKEFMTEVEVISKLQHRNLVRIFGCCAECEEKLLVYEFVPNGSLDSYIFDSQKQAILDWRKRVVIIEGICRGLLYLHRDSRLKIIHRDLKASNVLLDEELNPKISDFGTARIFGVNEDQAKTTRVVGTFGYMAPEYALQGRFSEKTDVYSFGVLLLEIVSGMKNNSFYHDVHELGLIAYAWKLWNENDVVSLTEPAIYDPVMETEVARYVQVGLLCVQEVTKDRPSISLVLSMLSNEIAELPCPSKPAFTVNYRTTETESSAKISSKSFSNNVSLTVMEGR